MQLISQAVAVLPSVLLPLRAAVRPREPHGAVTPRAVRMGVALLAASCLVLSGCQMGNRAPNPKLPVMASRFAPGAGPLMGATETLGLAVQCDDQPMLLRFAERLAGTLAREIELSIPGIRTVAWLPETLPGPGVAPVFTDNRQTVTVAFQSPESVLPPAGTGMLDIDCFQGPAGLSPPPVSLREPMPRCLQVRVLDYRPWSPMSASVRLTLFDAATMEPIAATTAAWTANEDGTGRGFTVCVNGQPQTPTGRWSLRKYFKGRDCHAGGCGPSAAHNSPEAMTQLIAEEIAAWLHGSPAMFSQSAIALPPGVIP